MPKGSDGGQQINLRVSPDVYDALRLAMVFHSKASFQELLVPHIERLAVELTAPADIARARQALHDHRAKSRRHLRVERGLND